MAKKMLIDAAHPEESRVVVLQGNRVEEFDFEAAAKRPLKGNIYLAKVTRVEPSLQAAFVDFGGNKHGFLAFSEIHPDYYQIPVADRQALIAQQEAAERSAPAEDEDFEPEGTAEPAAPAADEAPGNSPETSPETEDHPGTAHADSPPDEAFAEAPLPELMGQPPANQLQADIDEAAASDAGPVPVTEATAEEEAYFAPPDGSNIETVVTAEPEPPKPVETRQTDDLDDALEEARHRPMHHGRPYKIQEVIKRRQILLVQVVKEERGTKGAALTTYLSLAGRYCVLMPNTARGGGISRKITNQIDRKRLKSAAQDLEIPHGMGLIIRTAGANRTKAEVKRDFEYLLRVWENVRDLTLKSTAPALVYEEGSLMKRAIRDLYNKDIDTILVEGEEAYKEAKGFMRTLMPSHAKVVQPYREQTPLFQRFQVESQLDSMFSPTVTLRSGGYIVMNQTEALVAIDVNSGRSTRERSIEETALRTNLEAAEEAARQLRLRDLAGLIVIDFIDMEDNRNNRAVEKRLKDCLKVDRARIQIGRISGFGLLEMSRQRLRAGVLEGSTIKCPHCEGMGIVRSVESAALRALRAIEDEGIRGRTAALTLKVPTHVALYILNQKRAELTAIERRYELTCLVEADEELPAGGLNVMRTVQREPLARPAVSAPVRFETGFDEDDVVDEAEEEIEEGEDEAPEEAEDEAEERRPQPRAEARPSEENGARRKRRRRRRGRREDEPRGEGREAHPREGEHAQPIEHGEDAFEAAASQPEAEAQGDRPPADEADGEPRRRRRGRRGGRRNRRRDGTEPARTGGFEDGSLGAPVENEGNGAVPDHFALGGEDDLDEVPEHMPESYEDGSLGAPVVHDAPPRLEAVAHETREIVVETVHVADDLPTFPAALPSSAPTDDYVAWHEPVAHAEEPVSAPLAEPPPAPAPAPSPPAPSGPPRKGWWQRKFGG